MPTYLHPGVYIEEIPSGSKPIEGVSTSVTAFVGRAPKGPVGTAHLIGKLDDYVNDFGPIASEDDAMGLAVQSFYLNGGGAAYVCRLVGQGSNASEMSVNGQGAAGGAATVNPVLIISATSVGTWGNGVYVRIVKPDPDSLTFDLEIGHQEAGEFMADELFTGLSMRHADDNYALMQVNGFSRYVELSLGQAADPDDAGEQYQASTLTGGAIPDQADYFDTNITGPMALTLNVNGLGARQITIDPSAALAGADHDADGATVAAAIQTAVRALGTDAAYQGFTCTYAGGSNRVELSTPEADSAASIEVFGGDLASTLRLDSGHVAVLSTAALSNAATLFSSATTGIPSLSDTTLTLAIDEQSAITIDLDPAALGLAGSNQEDGEAVALAIQNAVRAVDPRVPAYKDFTCEYTSAREFVLSSGSGNPRQSNLEVTDGPLADLMGLNAADTPVLSLGREVEQGTAVVIPLESLGTLDQGVPLVGGAESAPTANDYGSFYSEILRKVRDVSIIVLPGEQWAADGSGNPIIAQTQAHCESTQSRVLIIDPPSDLELDQGATVQQMGLPTSTYTTLYYPWVDVANPFYNVDTNPTADRTIRIAPSAMAAGMWAKTDGKRGVWKAPAGVEAQLNGVAGLAYQVEDLEQDQLNPLGVNCIRKLPSFGSVIWGSRTLATKADPEWRYVPVRRTAIFIERSIYGGIQWAVFEPNNYPLWGSLRANIGSFMNGLFRAGAFQGATSDEAYFVRCGLGDTMTQGDIDRGQVIVIVGFAPLKPAEFVIVRIQQKVAQQ